MDPYAEHQRECRRLQHELAAAASLGAAPALAKSTSNLFRHRSQERAPGLDAGRLNRVLAIDRRRMTADVEGMTTYESLVDATLRQGLLPAVVPQLKTITVGGAVSGVGIESSSIRYGLVHQTVEEMEVLLADGSIVVCSAGSEPDLFYGFPNSYGTLGYALRLKIGLVPAERYVHVVHTRFSDPDAYFHQIDAIANQPAPDFVDGTVFGPEDLFLTTGSFADAAPYASDYSYLRVYYKSIPRLREDWLTVRSYIWRWDTDWFWCSRRFGLQNPILRLLATKWALNSRNYQRLMRLGHRVLPEDKSTESVIQDVDIPIRNAARFLRFLLSRIGITPVWICPFLSSPPGVLYDLYPLEPGKLHVNFGFWDTIASSDGDGHYNRMLEREAMELGGIKALYSTSYYDEPAFWRIYNGGRYRELKDKYDPRGVFLDLYAKCVGRR